MAQSDDPTNWRNLWQTNGQFWEMNKVPPATERLLASGLVPRGLGRGLVPGCGSGHDAFALSAIMEKTLGMDIVPEAIDRSRLLASEKGILETKLELRVGDFFALSSEMFDVILDHTFLCALPPSKRQDWASKMTELVRPGGVLITYMFPLAEHESGPPFALSEKTYIDLLRSDFVIVYSENVSEKFHKWKETTGERLVMWKRKRSD